MQRGNDDSTPTDVIDIMSSIATVDSWLQCGGRHQCGCRCAAAETCPAPYTVDFATFQSLSLRLSLVDNRRNVIDDASQCLRGSPVGVLEVPQNVHFWTDIGILLDLGESRPWCAELEIVAFRLTVLGVKSFAITIGDASSRVVKVCLRHHFDVVTRS